MCSCMKQCKSVQHTKYVQSLCELDRTKLEYFEHFEHIELFGMRCWTLFAVYAFEA